MYNVHPTYGKQLIVYVIMNSVTWACPSYDYDKNRLSRLYRIFKVITTKKFYLVHFDRIKTDKVLNKHKINVKNCILVEWRQNLTYTLSSIVFSLDPGCTAIAYGLLEKSPPMVCRSQLVSARYLNVSESPMEASVR